MLSEDAIDVETSLGNRNAEEIHFDEKKVKLFLFTLPLNSLLAFMHIRYMLVWVAGGSTKRARKAARYI